MAGFSSFSAEEFVGEGLAIVHILPASRYSQLRSQPNPGQTPCCGSTPGDGPAMA